jgi:hypothetical protein
MHSWRSQLRTMYRVGRIAGFTVAAVSLGVFLGGDHRPEVVGFGVCSLLFGLGQSWALSRES